MCVFDKVYVKSVVYVIAVVLCISLDIFICLYSLILRIIHIYYDICLFLYRDVKGQVRSVP